MNRSGRATTTPLGDALGSADTPRVRALYEDVYSISKGGRSLREDEKKRVTVHATYSDDDDAIELCAGLSRAGFVPVYRHSSADICVTDSFRRPIAVVMVTPRYRADIAGTGVDSENLYARLVCTLRLTPVVIAVYFDAGPDDLLRHSVPAMRRLPEMSTPVRVRHDAKPDEVVARVVEAVRGADLE